MKNVDLNYSRIAGNAVLLRACHEIETLRIAVLQIEDLLHLTALPHLHSLRLGYLRGRDLSALRDAPALQELELEDYYTSDFADLRDLMQNQHLRRLLFGRSPAPAVEAEIRSCRPDIEIAIRQ